jgi:hypothetical protein
LPPVTQPIEDRLHALDLGLLGHIESQTYDDDRRSLLALHCACRDLFGSFAYLEIGSHLGGSLQALIADPACEQIVSIDPRPVLFPDGMSTTIEYPDNSTERMLKLLRTVPGANMDKLVTIESDTSRLVSGDIPHRPRMCFIDGEHTNPTALRDAEFCLSVLRLPGVIVFHDNLIVGGAIGRFLRRTRGLGYLLRDSVFVVELGGEEVFRHPLVQRVARSPAQWIWANRVGLAHRAAGKPSPGKAIQDHVALRTRMRRRLGLEAQRPALRPTS